MRMLTRSDFDGLACSVLLEEKGIVDQYTFVHPKDVQDGKVEVNNNDVLANVPFVPGCGLWFDHHVSEEERLGPDKPPFEGASYRAPSAAQVVWDYFGGDQTFNQRLLPLLQAVNKSDSGRFTREEILYPKDWVMVSFLMDPRTGLGRFKDYRISNYRLMEDMIQYCRTMTAEEILEIPDVHERTRRYFDQQAPFKEMLMRSCRTEGPVIVTNLLEEEVIYTGNRFLVYALHPDQNVEVRIMWGREKQNIVITAGHSILNRTSQTNLGRLLLRYGGGGHERVATCQVPIRHWKDALSEILMILR